MAWSTRELAELAGVSPRAVRRYHEVGLLDEPERGGGSERYGAAHLVRLVRIKRLAGLGFSLRQIAAMGDGGDHPEEALRTLDAELAATIERLQRARVELGFILNQAAPTAAPTAVPVAVGAAMSDSDRSFAVVMTRVLGPQGLRASAAVPRTSSTEPADPAGVAFAELPADADERTRAALAERLVPFVRGVYAEHPGLAAMTADSPGGAGGARQVVDTALEDLYNPAQLDVLHRTRILLAETGPA